MSRKRSTSAQRNTRKLRRGNSITTSTVNEIFVNQLAIDEGPRRKSWNIRDLKHIQALTEAQSSLITDFCQGFNVIADGCPGTGKSYLACFLALQEFLTHREKYDKIIIVRSAVPTRDTGFLPGTLEEKMAIYETPYADIFADLLGRSSTWNNMKEAGVVEFHSTSYLRSITWDNAIVIFDEAQNGTFHEINSVITRLGENSRILICGDSPQADLPLAKGKQESGFNSLITVATKMRSFAITKFTPDDIVRSGFVREWIKACVTSNLL